MIESVRLEGFKNFRDATLPLGPLTVIVGTNASGKSNLRDAFRFLHGMARGYTLAEIIGEKYVEGGVLQWKGIRGGVREVARSGEQKLRLTTVLKPKVPMSLGPFRHAIEVDLSDSRSGSRVVRESLHNRARLVFDSHAADDPPEQEGSPYLFVRLRRDEQQSRRHGKRLRFLDSTPVVSQFVEHRQIPSRYKSVATLFCRTLESIRFLDLVPEAMKAPSIPGQVILGDRGENLSSVLQAICADESRKLAIAEWLRELTPIDVVDFEFVPDQTGRVLVTLVESNGQRTSAYSASDGTLRFLAMIAALLGPDAAKFYFLEEIDNGIHPTRLHLLLQLIEQQAKAGRVQIVTTTHSPQLLGMLSAEAREHACFGQGQPEGRIQRVMDIPEARRVLEGQNLSRLHESGWLEDAVAFADSRGGTHMNVLIIPEDFRKDQYVVKPLVRRMLAEIGKPQANVRVCHDPLMGGISEATKWERIKEVLDRYRTVHLFLLLVDRDGIAGRRASLNAIEKKAAMELGDGKLLLAENAWQEIEVWALAGQGLPGDWKWKTIRAEVHPKESYFEPLAKERGLLDEPGGGRMTMGREAAQNYSRVRSRCKEDIEALETRLKEWLADEPRLAVGGKL